LLIGGPKMHVMKTYQTILQTSIIILMIGLNSYSIGTGIRLQSTWGIVLALLSLAALGYCVHLFKKLKEVDTDEEYDNH
jgi:hypothetical protein